MVLSFFLWIGTICGFNQSEGGVQEFIDFWNMIVRMGAIVEAISFRILAGRISLSFRYSFSISRKNQFISLEHIKCASMEFGLLGAT